MIATFTPVNARGTILQLAVGNVLTVNLPGTRNRVVLIVSDADNAKVGDSRHVTAILTVTDLMTGSEHRLTGADCGLGCQCALTFV